MRTGVLAGVLVVLLASRVTAQPVAPTRDEPALAAAMLAITQDPAVPATDPEVRALAQALLTEGAKQRQDRAYDQALANFLAAYGNFPSPRILLDIAGTLRDLDRRADAANTYQRYLLDPAADRRRTSEVTTILDGLDAELTILVVRVAPRNAEVSIDGGPFVAVGSTLRTRVRPGLHLIRVRRGGAATEISINGFENETKEIDAKLRDEPLPSRPAPERVTPWLTNGTLYAAADATSNQRKTRATYQGAWVDAIVPDYELTESGEIRLGPPQGPRIAPGVIAVMRIDGEGRGFAGGFGLALSRERFEAELMVLRSELTGGFLGLRYRLLSTLVRPYLGLGVPAFMYTDRDDASHLAIGLRAAAGIELAINGHLSVQGDVGYEHFFVDERETGFDANVFVPTLGIIGRL